MSTQANAIPFERSVALDLHKHYVVVAAVNQRQEILVPPRRVEISELSGSAQQNLCQSDAVVIEAATNAWTIYNLLVPLVGHCGRPTPATTTSPGLEPAGRLPGASPTLSPLHCHEQRRGGNKGQKDLPDGSIPSTRPSNVTP